MRTRARIVAAAVGLALAALFAGPPRVDAGALADDGRAGVVTDVAGTALVRPAGRQRWSPIGPRSVLLPGDDVRTMTRGAHAAEIRLAGGGTLVVGPDAEVRLEARDKVRVLRGDAEITGLDGSPVAVSAPGGFEARAGKATVVRVEGGKGAALETPPRWLTGYRSSTTDEWMGSLLAKVDGRNVPLTVGYHKVNVSIRDQIAETVVEQSFVNSTDGTLEGVFSFPLPAGASVSGFGMWIGDEYVEADIVERERARAIYEDIKARRKDPGLLEWSGGNLFQASVFPIFGHSEKRVRLRYTQVLPLEGSLLRYRYALRSELLRTSPVRQLQIQVTHVSSSPLVSASSPTHEVRVSKSADTATIDFTAAEFKPDRDFEVVFGVGAAGPLRVVPHRRGDDGYFMLLLAPPDASAGAWKRDLVPEGDPLDVLFVADTSGSMGPAERGAQRKFVESALALLGPADRFRLMACDRGVAWLVGDPTAASPENAANALATLDRRWSLGWSDLDAAMSAAAERAKPGTVVVYVGDGIGTTGDADPVALAQRIDRLTTPAGAAFHAVAPGSAYEQGVLEAIARRGGGSVRSTGDDPAQAAFALLSEVAQPAVKDLKVEFEGLRTARVYPERLPNVAAGTQQIVLGRFLPEGAEQRGRAIVTGTLAGKPVRYTADVAIVETTDANGVSSNSFLPRLWARRHLDALLAEGRTPAIRDEIVSFSERFGILTPYTSLLVLESDADREMYGVGRRVGMRDGERFFADARGTARTAALREAMLAARTWRVGLRQQMLAEISGLGRDLLRTAPAPFGGTTISGVSIGIGGGAGGAFRQLGAKDGWDGDIPGSESARYYDVVGGGDGGGGGPTTGGGDFGKSRGDRNELDFEGDARFNAEAEFEGPGGEPPPDSREPSDPPAPLEEGDYGPGTPAGDEAWDRGLEVAEAASAPAAAAPRRAAGRRRAFGAGSGMGWARDEKKERYAGAQNDWLAQQLFARFPGLMPPPIAPSAPPPHVWDAEIAALLASVSEPDRLAPGGDVRVELTWLDVQTALASPDPGPVSDGRALLAPDRWFLRVAHGYSEPWDQWLSADRGVLTVGTRLGRRRPAAELDREGWAQQLGRVRYDFLRTYAAWTAQIERRDGTVVVVRLTAPAEQKSAAVFTIDTARRVVTEARWFHDGKPSGTRRVSDFVRAGGIWWATDEVQLDAEDRPTWRRTSAVREVPADEFQASFTAAMAGHEDVIFLGATDPSVADAKQAQHDARATFADHLALTGWHASLQRWDDADDAWAKARALVPGRPGADWLEATLWSFGRRGEDGSARLTALAASIAASKDPVAYALARLADELAQRTLQPGEQLTLLDRIERAGSSGADADALRRRSDFWRTRRATALTQAQRHAEAVALLRALWSERPADLQRASALLNALLSARELDAALDLFAKLDLAPQPMYAWVAQNAAMQIIGALWEASRFETVLQVADRWIAAQPDQPQAYQDRLSAILALGRADEFDRWIREQLAAPQAPRADRAAAARVMAAVNLALGQDRSNRWSGSDMDPKWVRPLAALARRASRDEEADAWLAGRVVQDWRFQATDGRRELFDGLRADLVAQGGVESPSVERLVQILSWLSWARNDVDAGIWRAVTDRVLLRMRAATTPAERVALLGAATRLLDMHLEGDEAIRVVRAELGAAAADRVPALAGNLAARLQRSPWTQEFEDETWALVPRFVAADAAPEVQRAAFAAAARWIVDRVGAARTEAGLGPKVDRERLPRAELKARITRVREDVRRALWERLGKEIPAAGTHLRLWYQVERVCLGAQIGTDLKGVEGDARELLLSAPSGEDDGVHWIARARAVLALSHVSVRRNAPEGLADRTVALLRERLKAEESSLDWRWAIFRLLVALDRPQELEAVLREWIVPAKVDSRWRIALAYLLAETARVADAVAQMEEVARLDEMDEAGYVRMSEWYLVLGDAPRRAAALERRWREVNEHELRNHVSQEHSRIHSRAQDGVPHDLDDGILYPIRALLAKATHPAYALHEVQALYAATKDVRLLESLADGVLGHSPVAVYPYLQATGGMIQGIHEEATCDEVAARIAARVPSARTDTDRRGLTLLTAQVERRAAEVIDQGRVHSDRALAALRAARKGEWLQGERRLMAEYLAALGKISFASLGDEQIAHLRELLAGEGRGTVDRFRIAFALARTQVAYGRVDDAVAGLSAAFDEHREASGGRLPQAANDVVHAWIDWQEDQRRFTAAETWLLAETARQNEPAARQWYERRTFDLYARCLEARGTTSLGADAGLYRAVRAKMEKALADHLPDQLGELVQSYCRLHRAAHSAAKVESVGADLVAFSRGLLVELLPRFGPNGAGHVRNVADAIRHISGPLPALTLLVEHLEREPDWRASRGGGYAAWNQFGWQLAHWRVEAGNLGALEPRLFAVVLRELERDLTSENSYGRYVFGNRRGREFWHAKADAFAATARRIVAESLDSPSRLLHVARYLHDDLELKDEAVRVLEDADTRKALREDGRWQLVHWHEEAKRWKEALPHAERLVAERPDHHVYRISLIRALHGVGRDDDGKALVDATRTHFEGLKKGGRLRGAYGLAAQLADVCLECGYFDRAVPLYNEAISERRRLTRGAPGDGEVARLWGALARSHSGLGQTDLAVDAATASVVAWGPTYAQRGDALQVLKDVLAAIPDLAAWTLKFEADAVTNGTDAPILRRTLAQIHVERRETDQALRHLLAARRVAPDDATIHAEVIRILETRNDPGALGDAIAAALEQVPRQPPLYEKLAAALVATGRPDDAERALTGLAEYAPNEPDGHRALAIVRARAGAHKAAAEQWQQVVRTRSSDIDAWCELAHALARDGRKAEAKMAIDEALKTPSGGAQRERLEQVRREIAGG